ncbi:hypothetical protein [Paenibacillus donghaensis]|uniref:Uncharacterized protein n=1 Tax=Paenibacillus donghaensis TaxID=414771 RepID=A0A2Z2KM02_9BACL|nr:hypothetical protein [Paenibacillus donghaensis]ASA25395.1 hypothetical protein B9T62_34475 [Paenibacillus donghaensis]
MTDQEKEAWARKLAVMYVLRRSEWFTSIDRGLFPFKQIAAAKLDQLTEVIETLPEDIKILTKSFISEEGNHAL